MVNIAFPYKDQDASAMNAALAVLQGMAEKGNRYIQACHSLLVRIPGNMKSIAAAIGANVEPGNPRVSGDTVPAIQNNGTARPTGAANGTDQTADSSLDLGSCEDPDLWAEVLDSIGIDMDRQWIESALLRE